jgi:hypothetical protein
MEHGVWTGTTGQQVTRGDYTAKWREVAGEWVIEAEIYLTLG